ncbi:MAG: FAD-dependent oxidoreductase [Myxococcota bacterium]
MRGAIGAAVGASISAPTLALAPPERVCILAAMRVLANAEETPGVRRLVLARPSGWSYRPGQVAELVRGPGTEGYFALASAPEEDDLAFLLKPAGTPSGAIAEALPGEEVEVRGPFGAGFELPDDVAAPLLFVGAGTSIAALRSGVASAFATRGALAGVTLACGVRRPEDLAFRSELARWQERGLGLRIVVSRPEPSDGWSGPTGWVQAWLSDLATRDSWAFIAGSDAFEDAVEAALVAAAVPRERIQRNYRRDWRTG